MHGLNRKHIWEQVLACKMRRVGPREGAACNDGTSGENGFKGHDGGTASRASLRPHRVSAFSRKWWRAQEAVQKSMPRLNAAWPLRVLQPIVEGPIGAFLVGVRKDFAVDADIVVRMFGDVYDG